jgi:hypothetical protein
MVAGRGCGGEKKIQGKEIQHEKENKLSFLEGKNTVRMRAKISPHTYKKQVQY